MAKQSTIITDGTTEIELVFDSSSQPNWRLQFNERVEGGSPRPQWHRPQSAPPELIELASNTGEARFRLNIRQDDDIDTVLNKIVELSRWIDGENQQAARYHTHGDVDRIELKVQRKNATNATVWPIVFGEIDDGGAHYTEMADFREWAEGVTIRLFLAPYGEAETAITLANVSPSSPHAISDRNGDGVADGWDQSNTSSRSLDTDEWLIGGSSQKFTTDTFSTVTVRTPEISISGGEFFAAYIWIRSESGSDNIKVQLQDSAGTIQSKVFQVDDAAGVSDKTAVATSGNTWYRIPLSGQADGAASWARIRLVRDNANVGSTYYADGCYITTGTTTVPDAWMSARAIDNRNDPTSASPDLINYIDVWGVPGDASALVDTKLKWTTITGTGKGLLYASRFADGRILAADVITWVGSDDISAGTTANASFSTGSGTSEDHFHRLTQDGTANEGKGRLGVTFTGDDARALLTHPQRMFWLVRTSDLATRYKVLSTTPAALFSTDGVGVQTVDQWEIIDMGLFNLQGIAPLDPPDTSNPSFTLTIEIDGLPASGSDTADLDALIFMPTVDEFVTIEFIPSASTSNELHIRGQDRDVVVDTRGIITDGVLGTLWELEPGNKMSRLIFALADRNDSEYAITDAARVTLTVVPRTRHLLGTT